MTHRTLHCLTVLAAWASFSAAAPVLAAETPPTKTASYATANAGQFMRIWQVLGPIPVFVGKADAQDLATQKQAFARDYLADHGGEAGVQPKPGLTHKIAGKDFSWRLVQSPADTVDLIRQLEPAEFAVAYAWAEIVATEPAKVLLGVGSDDGIKIWLNGKLVHQNWAGRAIRKDDDTVPVTLQKGKNQLLLKIQNQQGSWGFVCRQLDAEALAGKFVTAANLGDLEAVKTLLDQGANINATNKLGLTPLHATKMRGNQEMVEFLLAKGADAKRPLPPPETLVDAMFKEIVPTNSPGAAVLVARNGKILFQHGYGEADREKHLPITPDTQFRIGSITKQFTATAILQLQEQGKLSVNDSLAKFFPDFPRGKEVKLHHLLTHTSGIKSYTDKPGFLESAPTFIQPDDLINSFKNDPYDFSPGHGWHYDNSGYFLLGEIVAKVSGEPFADYLRKHIFEPLGMKHTGIHYKGIVLEHEAIGYSYANGESHKALDWDMSRAGGAGALYSTVGDLFLWNEAVFNGKILKPASRLAAFTPVKLPPDAQGMDYGFGWITSVNRGLRVIGHSGGLNGFSSDLARFTNHNLTVVVLANAMPTPPGLVPSALAQEIGQLYLWPDMEPRKKFVTDSKVDPKSYDDFVGRYDYGGAICEITREGNRLFAQLTNQPKLEIFPSAKNEFFWKVVDAQLKFERNEKGEVVRGIHRQNGQTIKAAKLPALVVIKVDSARLAAYAGRYDYGNGAVLTVTKEGDRLFAQMTGQGKAEIFPNSETEFFWKIINAQITFVKNDKGEVIKAIHQQGGAKIEAPRLK